MSGSTPPRWTWATPTRIKRLPETSVVISPRLISAANSASTALFRATVIFKLLMSTRTALPSQAPSRSNSNRRTRLPVLISSHSPSSTLLVTAGGWIEKTASLTVISGTAAVSDAALSRNTRVSEARADSPWSWSCAAIAAATLPRVNVVIGTRTSVSEPFAPSPAMSSS